MLLCLTIGLISLLVLFVYCACVVSSKCSNIEKEDRNNE